MKNISIPEELFKSMYEAHQKWDQFDNDLEDFLLSNDQEFLDKMNESRKEHLQNKTRILNRN